MEINNSKYRIFIFILAVVLIGTLALLSILISDNQNLKNQIYKREDLIEKTVIKETQISNQKTRNDSIIERFIDDCGIRVNNKKVTSEELLILINAQLLEIDILKKKQNELNDSLQIYQSYNRLSKKNFGAKYNVEKKDEGIVSTISYKQDSLTIYKKLYKLMQKDYGVFYKVEEKVDTWEFTKRYSKLDSALFVYQHYKHVLSVNAEGELSIDLPSKKEVRNSTSNQKRK